MKASRLNRSLRVSRISAEQHLPELERIYASLIRATASDAARALVASAEVTVTAAANVPRWQIPPDGVLFAIATVTDRATRRLSRLHRRIVTQTAKPPLARAGIAWDITHPLSQNLLEQAGARTGEMLGQTIRPVLTEVVAQAYADGLSVIDAAALIREKFAEASPAQAAMLARTDLNGLSNGGSVMAASLVGVAYKQWLTAEDDRVRETHADADGQTVPVDESFDVGGELLDYPGDPSGSDAEVANCRCTVVYVDADEAEIASAAPTGRIPSRGFMVNWTLKTADDEGDIVAVHRIPTRGFAAAAMPQVRWISDVAFEGMATDDGRYILPGSLTWRDLPLSLGAMFDTPHADMVMASPVCGRIDTLERADTNMDGDQLAAGVSAVRATGEFDMGGEEGANVARLVADETMRGVSIDLAVDDWCFRDPETGDLIEPDEATDAEMERAMFGELQYAVRAGTIMAATVCPTPAFANARIALVASGERRFRLETLFQLASDAILASAAPIAPPAEWFHVPEPNEPTPLTVTDNGQVYGHVATWNSCHTGRSGICVTPPRSPSGYAYFNLGEVKCADGGRVSCGQIFFHGEHAPLTMTAQRVRDHYAHSGLVGADVRAVDGRHGIWVCGALRSTLTPEQAREFMAAKPSGDWRQMAPGAPLELTAVLAVNDPGFPVPRLVASAEDEDGEAVALFAAFEAPDDDEMDEIGGRVPARGFARV